MKKYYKEFYILLTVHPCIIMHISSTRCKILFNIFIYFSSLHVSAIHMPIIRRKLLYFCFTDICHCVWLESGQTRRNPYRVTNISDAQIQQFSPDDRHVDDRNMQRREINKYIIQNCAPSWIYLRDITKSRGRQKYPTYSKNKEG